MILRIKSVKFIAVLPIKKGFEVNDVNEVRRENLGEVLDYIEKFSR